MGVFTSKTKITEGNLKIVQEAKLKSVCHQIVGWESRGQLFVTIAGGNPETW